MRGDKVALIPLVRPRHVKGDVPDLAGATSIGSGRGPATLFAALTLPLHGRLDPEGQLVDIDRDDNTLAVERAFGMPASDLADKILRGTLVIRSLRSPTPAERDQWAKIAAGRRVELQPTQEQLIQSRKRLGRFGLGKPAGCWIQGIVTADKGDRWEIKVTASSELLELPKDSPRVRRDPLDLAADIEFEERVGACFVHYRAYAAMALHYPGEHGKDAWSLWGSSGLLAPAVLEQMGFVRQGLVDRQRYNVAWEHPKFPRVTLYSDGLWCEVKVRGMRRSPDCFSPQDLAKLLAEHGGGPRSFSPKIRQRMRATSYMDTLYDLGTQQIREQREIAERSQRYGLRRPGYPYLDGGNMFSYGLDPGFPDRFWADIEPGTLRPHAVGFWTFLRNMTAANRLLMPCYCGTKYGNHRAHRLLLRLGVEILDHKIAAK